MIVMEELKPILEPLLNEENSADIIGRIQEIDREVDNSAEVERINKEWNQKFKDAFLSGKGVPEVKTEEKEEVEEKKTPRTFEELFTFSKK